MCLNVYNDILNISIGHLSFRAMINDNIYVSKNQDKSYGIINYHFLKVTNWHDKYVPVVRTHT